MSSPTRREKIEAMLADTPEDTFLRYALALEWEKEGEHDKSIALLRGLMEASHVASFFMAAQHLAKRGEYEETRAILRAGIEAARSQGDSHAASEMSEFLANLGGMNP